MGYREVREAARSGAGVLFYIYTRYCITDGFDGEGFSIIDLLVGRGPLLPKSKYLLKNGYSFKNHVFLHQLVLQNVTDSI